MNNPTAKWVWKSSLDQEVNEVLIHHILEHSTFAKSGHRLPAQILITGRLGTSEILSARTVDNTGHICDMQIDWIEMFQTRMADIFDTPDPRVVEVDIAYAIASDEWQHYCETGQERMPQNDILTNREKEQLGITVDRTHTADHIEEINQEI